MIPLEIESITVQAIDASWLLPGNLTLDVLRLDKIHPIISGNKWFKLKYYLQEAKALHHSTIATFGGAWSNHIAATAYACKQVGLKSVGIIRGEESSTPSDTLLLAKENGMQLIFVSREQYKNKLSIQESLPTKNWYWIDEGGFGATGAKGAGEILGLVPAKESYTHLVAAVGTGTMLSGLINAAQGYPQIIGISSMKGNNELHQNVQLLTPSSVAAWNINHEYHFGGYGKHPPELIQFINDIYTAHQLPLDIVYTAKTFFAIKDLAAKKHFSTGSKILFIHSGGLQGNRSLSPEVLAF